MYEYKGSVTYEKVLYSVWQIRNILWTHGYWKIDAKVGVKWH